MAYEIIEKIKPRSPSPVNYKNYKPYRKNRRNISPRRSNVRLKSSATQTLPRGQIIKAQELLYLHKIYYKGNAKINFRARTIPDQEHRRKEIVPNQYELFVEEQKASLIQRRYTLHHYLSFWYHKMTKRKGAREQQQILDMEKKRQLLDYSTPEMMVDEKRDTIKQDEKSLVVNEELPQEVHLELSTPIAQKTRNLKTPSEIIFDSKLLDGTRFDEKEETPPKSPKALQKESKNTKSQKSVKTEPDAEVLNPKSSSTEYYSSSLYSPNAQFSDSENDLIEEANNVMYKLSQRKSRRSTAAKPEEQTHYKPRPAPIETNPEKLSSPYTKQASSFAKQSSPYTKQSSPYVNQASPYVNQASPFSKQLSPFTKEVASPQTQKQESSPLPSPKKSPKQEINVPQEKESEKKVQPGEDAYLSYTRGLLDKYEKDDNEIPKITTTKRKPIIVNDFDSNNDTTEMFLEDRNKYTNSYTSRIDSILNYGISKPSKNKIETSTIFDSSNDEKKVQKTVVVNDRRQIMTNLDKGNRLLAAADALLSEEEEKSELFDAPPNQVKVPEAEKIKSTVSTMDRLHQKVEQVSINNESIINKVLKDSSSSSRTLKDSSTNTDSSAAATTTTTTTTTTKSHSKKVLESKSTGNISISSVNGRKQVMYKGKTELEEQLARLEKLRINDTIDTSSSYSNSLDSGKKAPTCVVSVKDAVEVGRNIPDKAVKKVVYTAIVSDESEADMVFLELDSSGNSSVGTVQDKISEIETPGKPTLF